jgi:hypothetical protein
VATSLPCSLTRSVYRMEAGWLDYTEDNDTVEMFLILLDGRKESRKT